MTPDPKARADIRDRVPGREAVMDDAARSEAAEAARAEAARDALRTRPAPEYRPRRRRWPGVLAAALIGAAIAGVMVSNYYSERTLGERLDSAVDKAGQTLQQGAEGVKSGAAAVAEQGAQAGANAAGTVAQKVDDVTITAAIKTALAADPALSALAIDVTTRDGVVSLEGPAPNQQARERAAVLAAAPAGVLRVENRLLVGNK